MNDLNELSTKIAGIFSGLFSKRSANASAKKEKFTKRKPKKLDGFSFLLAMTLGRFKKSAQ